MVHQTRCRNVTIDRAGRMFDRSHPVLDKFHNYLLEIQTEVLPKSPEGRTLC
jgi:hypothetical protein